MPSCGKNLAFDELRFILTADNQNSLKMFGLYA